MNIIIFGATSRIAECCAREWIVRFASTPVNLLLVGRNAEKLNAVGSDLQLQAGSASTVRTQIADLGLLETLPAVAQRAFAGMDTVDIVLIAHGALPDQTLAEQDPRLALDALLLNGVSPALLAERAAEQLARQGHGVLAVIGSVAGDRGRKSNYLYGAAKALLDCQLEGLRHRLWNRGVRVITVKPGPTATPMTAGLPPSTRLATPEQVARDIVDGIARGKPVIYTPGRWRLIMLVIRGLPRSVFQRLPI